MSVFTNNLSDSFTTSDTLFKGAIVVANFVDTLGSSVTTGNALSTENGNTITTEASGSITTDSRVTEDFLSSTALHIYQLTDTFTTSDSLRRYKFEVPESNRITRTRTLKSEIPVSYKTVRNRTYKYITPQSYRFTRIRTIQVTAGTFSYLHSGFIRTLSDSLPESDQVNYNYTYTRTLADTVINPKPTGDVIGSENGNVLGDELGNSIGSETLTFNDAVSSTTTVFQGVSAIYFSNLSETLPLLALVNAHTPISTRSLSDTSTLVDALSTQIIYSRQESDGSIFYLTTDSGSGIYDSNGNNIVASGTHFYDTNSYYEVKTRTPSDSFTTSVSLSSTYISVHQSYTANLSESILTTDTLSTQQTVVRFQTDITRLTDTVIGYTGKYYPTDTLTTSDSLAGVRSYSRSLSDTLTTTGVLAQTYPKSATDTFSTSDSLAYALIRNRTLTNVTLTSFSDSIAVTRFYTRTESDTITTSASLNNTDNHFTLSDTLTLVDVLSNNEIYARSITESSSFTDSVTSVKHFGYTTRATDVFTVSDSVSYTIFRYNAVNLSDTLTTSDSLFDKIQNRGRNPSENFNTTDSVSGRQHVTRLDSENLTTSDTLAHVAVHTYNLLDDISSLFGNRVERIRSNTRDIVETTQVVDSVTRGNLINHRLNSETLNVVDAVSHQTTLHRQALETNRGSQTVTGGRAYTYNLSETFVTSDVLAYIKPATIYLSDHNRLDVTQNRRVTYYRDATDILRVVATALGNTVHYEPALNETMLGSQSVSYKINFGHVINDTGSTVSDSVSALILPASRISENLPTSTQVSYHIKPGEQLVENLITYDALTLRIIPAVNLVEVLLTSATVQQVNGFFISETLPAVRDTVSYTTFYPLKANLEETLNTALSLDAQFKPRNFFLTENLVGSSSVESEFKPRHFVFTENLVGSNSVASYIIKSLGLTETIVSNDSLVTQIRVTANVSESFNTVDTVDRLGTETRILTDTTRGSDKIAHHVVIPKALADNLTTSDSVTRTIKLVRKNTDALTTSPVLTRQITAHRKEIYFATRNDTSLTRHVIIERGLLANFTTADIYARLVRAPRTLDDSSTVTDGNSRFLNAPRNPIVDLPTTISLNRFDLETRSLSDTFTFTDASSYFIARQALLQDTTAVSDAINRVAFYTRRPIDTSLFIDVPKPNTIKYRRASAAMGLTEYVQWRHPFIFSNEIFESYKTGSSLDYAFEILEISLPIELYSNVLFKNKGVVGKGRIVSIGNDTYTIAPYAGTATKGENFYVVPKSNVALLPPNYR